MATNTGVWVTGDIITQERANAKGLTVASSIPSNPTTSAVGQLWYDLTNTILKEYDGTSYNAVKFTTSFYITPNGPNDGGSFGPLTPGTTTSGWQEAINAIPGQGGQIYVVAMQNSQRYTWSSGLIVPNDRPISIEPLSSSAYQSTVSGSNQQGVSVVYTGTDWALKTSGSAGVLSGFHHSLRLRDLSFQNTNVSHLGCLNFLNLEPELEGNIRTIGIGTAAVSAPPGSIGINFDFSIGNGGNGWEATVNSLDISGFDVGFKNNVDHLSINHLYVEACNTMIQIGTASNFPNAFTANYIHLYTHSNYTVTYGIYAPATLAIPNGMINHIYFEPTLPNGSYTYHLYFANAVLPAQGFLIGRMHGQAIMSFGGTAGAQVQVVQNIVGPTYATWNISTTNLPISTGISNFFQNPYWFPIEVYIPNGTYGTVIGDPSASIGQAIPDQFPITLRPYEYIYFTTAVPAAWKFKGL